MFSCSVADGFYDIVMALGRIVINAVNSLWGAVDFSGMDGALTWFCRLDRWLPVSEFFRVLGILGTLAALGIVFKMGLKCVDWARG